MLKNTTSAFKISTIYLIFSLLWIYFSDNAINFIIKDFEEIQFLQTMKGLFFVTFSSLLLYLLSKQFFINLQKEKDKLANANNILELCKIFFMRKLLFLVYYNLFLIIIYV